MTNNEKALQMHKEWNGKLETTAKAHVNSREREFDTLKSKKVLQSLETGLYFCQIFIFNI